MWKLDRLARSTRDLLETMETIREAGARFQSLSEPWANTTTHAGKLIMTVFAGIAEFERDLIRERTSAGREAARRRGIHFGRSRKLKTEQAKLARRLIDEGKSVREIAETFNVHTATIYRLSAVARLTVFSVALFPRGCEPMTAALKKLEDEAMKLPARSRARLAERLISSLDEEGTDPNAEKLWAQEAQRRAEELASGRLKGVPAKKVLRKARAALR